jgi:hypothetical protein
VHGLLRERLLSGKEALGGALTAARRAYEAVSATPTLPLTRRWPPPKTPRPNLTPNPNPNLPPHT